MTGKPVDVKAPNGRIIGHASPTEIDGPVRWRSWYQHDPTPGVAGLHQDLRQAERYLLWLWRPAEFPQPRAVPIAELMKSKQKRGRGAPVGAPRG